MASLPSRSRFCSCAVLAWAGARPRHEKGERGSLPCTLSRAGGEETQPPGEGPWWAASFPFNFSPQLYSSALLFQTSAFYSIPVHLQAYIIWNNSR